MGHRLMITLDPKEFVALAEMASKELRHPREQMRILVRDAAREKGLLPTESPESTVKGAQQHAGAR